MHKKLLSPFFFVSLTSICIASNPLPLDEGDKKLELLQEVPLMEEVIPVVEAAKQPLTEEERAAEIAGWKKLQDELFSSAPMHREDRYNTGKVSRKEAREVFLQYAKGSGPTPDVSFSEEMSESMDEGK